MGSLALTNQYSYGIVGVATDAKVSGLKDWKEKVDRRMQELGGYSVANQSCQEFVIYMMAHICDPFLVNMSDFKSMIPIAIVVTVLNFTMLWDALLALMHWTLKDLLSTTGVERFADYAWHPPVVG